MSDRTITLLELHLHDGIRLAAGGREFDLVRSGNDDGHDTDVADEGKRIGVGGVGDDDASTPRKVGKLLITIAIVAALTMAVRKYRSSDADTDAAEELDELAV